ncbi:MAG: single-stranded-DNA-specific exonuclease RecJ, partial [Limnochordia bacterium]|nr:single-stranded-DNA-specific exonuclease RecJ [Limnochordia bacterium]
MGRKRKKWILRGQDTVLATELADGLGIRPVVAQVLLNRGITSIEAGRQFFACDLREIPDPFLMLGMDMAVARVRVALEREEPIVVYGDYDADGQTATALLVTSLRELATLPAAITYYLPDRFAEGYGLNRDALTILAGRASLLITVDCGISSVEDIEYAQGLGLDVIVTDHHEPGPILPAAVAVLNPKQKGCSYPFRHLAGVGVACKLVQALGAPNWQEHLDFVALGTVADLVPLEGENRTLVSHGLQALAQTKKPGLLALQRVADVTEPAASDLGFRLAPRLNAAGRLGDPSRGVCLLLTQDEREASQLAAELHQENALRQDVEAAVLDEAISVVERYRLQERSALVVWGDNWHQGVVGIVASRLVERYYLPTVVVSISGEEATASARSIAGLDLYQALSDCAGLLSKFGGHTMAAGLSLPRENLLSFQQLFEEICRGRISPDDYIPKLYVDDTIELAHVSTQLIKELGDLEPHGHGNPGPLLQAEVSVLQTRTVGAQSNHLQLTVRDETLEQMAAIAFGHGDQQEQIERNAERLALAFVPGLNEWRNKKTLQLTVKEWEPRACSDSYIQKWMIDRYPWRLGASYYQSRALHVEGAKSEARAK